ncbi:MAG: hypothetical protein GY927_20830 [bacterium]|nr:hypothetical protein [bacterium]
MTLAIFTIILVVSLISATIATALAHRKNRTWLLWGIMCMFLPPLVFILIFLPTRSGPAPFERESNGDDDDDIYGDKIEYRW